MTAAVTPGVDLLALTAEIIDIPSPSFHEQRFAEVVEARLRACGHLTVERVGDNVIARTDLGADHRLLLAGHLDTVPANNNETAIVDGDRVSGLGASDMKGGLACMLALAEAVDRPAVDVTYVFYACEEVPAEHNGLAFLARERPELLEADAAILGEPTSAEIEAGCQGTLRIRAVWHGERAHTARPWMGRNAIHRLGPVLERLEAYEARRPVIAGCEFHEAVQVVGVSGGVAGNVVPDRAELLVNHRFAPDKTSEEAIAFLLELLGDPDEHELTDLSPAAPPGVDHPLLAAVRDRSGLEVKAKLGWTDVARFAELGIPAINLGPGDAHLAHTQGEWVERDQLERAYSALASVLVTGL